MHSSFVLSSLVENSHLLVQIPAIFSRFESVAPPTLTAPSSVPAHLECPLCLEIFLEPVTVICGHSFCHSCLTRSLDHKNQCPLCRSEIPYLPPQGQTANPLCLVGQAWFPSETRAREEMANAHVDTQIGLFICTTVFPGLAQKFHIFEPRYRLLIRRALAKNGEFGIVASMHQPIVGTLVRIEEHNQLPDGRFMIKVVGVRRFTVREASMLDGYVVASVDWFDDQPEEPQALASFASILKERFHSIVANLGPDKLADLEAHFGQIPEDPAALSYWLADVLLPAPAQRMILSRDTAMQRLGIELEVMQQINH